MKGDTLLETISELKVNLQKYLETKVSYYGLLAFEKAVKLLNYFISHGVVMIIFVIALVFLSGAVAIYIGKLIESLELGLLLVGGAYLLFALILYIFRNRIFSPCIIRILLNIFFQKDDE